MEPEIELVDQSWVNRVDVGEGKVPKLVWDKYRESRDCRSPCLACRKRVHQVTVSCEEAAIDPALVRVQQVQVHHELVFIKGTWFAERGESPRVKRRSEEHTSE